MQWLLSGFHVVWYLVNRIRVLESFMGGQTILALISASPMLPIPLAPINKKASHSWCAQMNTHVKNTPHVSDSSYSFLHSLQRNSSFFSVSLPPVFADSLTGNADSNHWGGRKKQHVFAPQILQFLSLSLQRLHSQLVAALLMSAFCCYPL